MSQPALTSDDISFLEAIAREAGATAVEMREGVAVRTKTGPSDFVTDADLKCSQIVKAALAKRFPNDLIVSEEDKHPEDNAQQALEQSKHPRVWLIDPIDGTENYVKQDGQWSVMIGLLVDGAPNYGCIFQPSTSTLFYGGIDVGAWKQVGNREPVRYLPSDHLADQKHIRLMMGWGDRRKHPWIFDLPRVRYVSSDSLGLKIIKILENHADIFMSLSGKVKLWDTAAPAAIARAANLDVGTAEGEPLPFPIPSVQHGSSVIIGRPGSIEWVRTSISKRANQERTKSSR